MRHLWLWLEAVTPVFTVPGGLPGPRNLQSLCLSILCAVPLVHLWRLCGCLCGLGLGAISCNPRTYQALTRSNAPRTLVASLPASTSFWHGHNPSPLLICATCHSPTRLSISPDEQQSVPRGIPSLFRLSLIANLNRASTGLVVYFTTCKMEAA